MGCLHHRRRLQGSLANRAFLQNPQATTQGQEFRGYLPERPAVSIMDGYDCLLDAQLHEIQIEIRLVALYLEQYPTHEPIQPKKSMGLAQPTFQSYLRSLPDSQTSR